MFINVQAFVFHAGLYAQAGEFLYTEEQQESADSSPGVNYQDTKALYSQEMSSTTIEQATVSS